MSLDEGLDRLAAEAGILSGYHDIWGRHHRASNETLRALLAAMGLDARDETAVARTLAARETQAWRRPLPPVAVTRLGQAPRIPLVVAGDAGDAHLRWSLVEEQGPVRTGDVRSRDLERIDGRCVDGRRLCRYMLTVPPPCATGYHRLEVCGEEADRARMRLIVAPPGCHVPAALAGGRRVWGVAVQLYGLRSRRNWGIGDFGDLSLALETLAGLGADFVGLNPLHALSLATPECASPYSPSTRRFLNPLYLDVEAMADFAECDAPRDHVRTPEFRDRLARLRASPLVDYPLVSKLKLEVLTMLYAHFRVHHLETETERGRSFRAFQARGGRGLRRFAIFETLAARRREAGIANRAPNWLPTDALTAPGSEDVGLVELHEYLQWQTSQQLESVAEYATSLGMGVGLYLDLAVGADAGGAEVWSQPDAFAVEASIGAPPDDFSLEGQSWNLAPWRPHELIEAAYEPFVQTLRAAMLGAGALRIDHVVGLMRQFWVPARMTPATGAYVSYPVDDLLGIVALESERNCCLVVGEDLGTVPTEMRTALREHGMLSHRVLYFEKHWHDDGSFMRPVELPVESLVTVSTHDLPTFAGYWTGHDLDVRASLGLISGEVLAEHRGARQTDRARLMQVLAREGLVSEQDAHPGTDPSLDTLSLAVHRYIARSKCRLMSVQMEDVLGLEDQVNLPGTVSEHPNWRRRLPLDVEDWRADRRLERLAEAISAERA